ncbi:MAG TPA: glycoside hydrolase family 38 C-terminal domain-containing protein [Streptosporangiaceae bacterium]|nr:glycoside hydrolase family 38 C-terminal domain-containing protein [Streptosporangiaceae bacterium]
MRITGVDSTDLFGGTAAESRQIVRVRLVNAGPGMIADLTQAATVQIEGPAVGTPEPAVITGLTPGAEVTAEVAVETTATPGTSLAVQAMVSWPGGSVSLPAAITVAEPGWVMWMVSHFHYDPVWWSTQGEFTQARLSLPDAAGQLPEVRTAFELVRLHLDAARRDPDYKFVLAELDYLKPHFDSHPEDRADLLDLIAAGRIELVGGSYNEPNTNLTCAESTIRNAVYGMAYQRDVLGGNPRTSWMLDAFGFDPGYPGIMAAAGLTSSAWARGPFHQWGPHRSVGDNSMMQFASEFEWLSPDGTGLLTSYMANHYGAGWVLHQAKTLADAEAAAYEQFSQLAPVAATRNVLLPVGADHVIPARWATAVHRDWNSRYVWPRFVTAVPSEFFAAVRAEAADRDIWITPQTRDMNPVYTGKDVTYIDTKQAQRAAETAVLDGERLATLAWLAGADYPVASLDKAWRLLVFGAHHDAITGSEGDQVYLDLLGGWREAWERGDQARTAAVTHLAGRADTMSLTDTAHAAHTASATDPANPTTPSPTSAVRAAATASPAHTASATNTASATQTASPAGLAIVAVNSLSQDRSAMVCTELKLPPGWPAWLSLHDDAGAAVPFLAEGSVRAPDGGLRSVTITFRATVPGVGYRSYLVRPSGTANAADGWRSEDASAAFRLENEVFVVEADPARGGTLSRVLDKRSGTELLRAAGGGNELLLQPEHPGHPRWAEGPWLLCPAGPGTGTTTRTATVRMERCPVGARLVAELELGGLQLTQETLLWDGADRVEFRTHVDGSIGQDHLLRVAFPADVPGGLPVYQTAVSAIGRPPGPIDSDVAEHSYTLDSPACEWLAIGSTAAVALTGAGRARHLQAIGVAEVIAPATLRAPVRHLVAALAGQGVTATCCVPDGPRYGYQELDSNLPDFRICLGGPAENQLTAEVLATAGPTVTSWLTAELARHGSARLWLPASRSRTDAFAAGADLRGPRDLPVLIVVAADLADETARLIADLADAVIEATPAPASTTPASTGAADPSTHSTTTGSTGTGNAADTGPAGGPGTALAGHSVALLNRGTPSGLVTPDGMLTMALMRACSTWPCGVWIDGKQRTTPDGSSFAWQHWSHTFEYALTAGPGTWRTAGFAPAGQAYNHDLIAVTTELHPGPLPASERLVRIEPSAALLSALKPRGNPLAPGGQPAATDGITVRLRDIGGGGPVAARVGLFTGIAAANVSDLCEDAAGPAIPVADGQALATVPGSGLTTLVVTPDPAGLAGARQPGAPAPQTSEAAETPETFDAAGTPEPVQPVFARYWLHGKGPAPAGNMPVAVHLSPGVVALDDGQPGVLRLTVACGPEPASGLIRLAAPADIVLTPEGPLSYQLGSLGQQAFDVTVTARPGTRPGRWFARAQIEDLSGQVIEDSALIAIGQPPPPRTDLPLDEVLAMQRADRTAVDSEVDVSLITPSLAITPGGSGRLEVAVRNRADSAIHGEAQLISPYGSWRQTGPWTTSFEIEAGDERTLTFAVGIPATARPGERWWAIVKLMYFGRLHYTEPAEVTVR